MTIVDVVLLVIDNGYMKELTVFGKSKREVDGVRSTNVML